MRLNDYSRRIVKMFKTQCSECDTTFRSQSSLSRHKREQHEKTGPTFICFHCGREFLRKRNLTIHIQSAHSSFADLENLKPSQPKFTCEECGRQLARKRTWLRHIEIQHSLRPDRLSNNTKSQTCVKCHKDFVSELLILKHIENDHGIPLQRETLSFEGWDNFVRWKDDIETKTFCRYVKRTTSKLKFEDVVYYYCERRGFHVPPGQRKRREWSHGTKKINGYCPAKILVRKHLISGDIRATYCSTHMHSIEPTNLKYSRFSDDLKNAVAEKLAAQIPIDKILKDVRTSKSKEYLEKGQMMTRKDILNIARKNNMRNLNRKSIRAAVEIEAFTQKHSESILLYKKQGQILERWRELRAEDFVLIYMNEKQKEHLRRFGNNVLAADETHGLAEHGFILHTLMVLDDFDQGFPACFLFTNRDDEVMMEILFECIKQAVGMLNVNTFMSDMQEKCYNAYLKVMEHKPNFYLYCTWRVRKEWKHHLMSIKNVEKRRETEKQLISLHESNDISEFEQKLSEFCAFNFDPDLTEFMQYFSQHFVVNTKQWAYCYRQYSGINTSMVVKNFHRQIKHNFGNGSKFTRLQDGLALIESYMENREQNDMINNIKGHIPTKVAILRKTHDEAKRRLDAGVCILNDEDDENSWVVESFSSSGTEYVVTRCGDCVSECKLMCEKCFCCIHMFKCSCLENSIKHIMCKHIHAVCLQQVVEQEVVENVESESEMVVEDDISISSPIAVYHLSEEEEFKEFKQEFNEDHEDKVKPLDVSEQNRKLFDSIMNVAASSPAKSEFVRKALEDLEVALLALQDHEWKFDEEKIIP